MTDLICRKSMTRCLTPGMCSPHGGCREPAFNPDWNRLEAAQESLREHMQIIAQLKAENERLAANVKLNLCDHPAIHLGDVDLLIAFVSGTSQIELAKMHGCTPPNISRKIRRVKARLGWRKGMSVAEIRARAEQLRALASQGAVITADLMAERDQLKSENEALLVALKGMTSMYGYCWDIVDGGLLCMQDNVQRFEDAHEAAQKVIAAMGKGGAL